MIGITSNDIIKPEHLSKFFWKQIKKYYRRMKHEWCYNDYEVNNMLVSAEQQSIEPCYLSSKELDEEYVVELNNCDGSPLRVTNLEKTIIEWR